MVDVKNAVVVDGTGKVNDNVGVKPEQGTTSTSASGQDKNVGSDETKAGSDNDTVGTASSVVESVKSKLTNEERILKQRKDNLDKINALLAENEKLDEQIRNNRNKCRTNFGMKIYASVYTILGLKDVEKECNTKKDFENLKKTIEGKLKGLVSGSSINNEADSLKDQVQELKRKYEGIDLLQYECFVPGYCQFAKNLGFDVDLHNCKTKEDYAVMHKKMLIRTKELIYAEQNNK